MTQKGARAVWSGCHTLPFPLPSQAGDRPAAIVPTPLLARTEEHSDQSTQHQKCLHLPPGDAGAAARPVSGAASLHWAFSRPGRLQVGCRRRPVYRNIRHRCPHALHARVSLPGAPPASVVVQLMPCIRLQLCSEARPQGSQPSRRGRSCCMLVLCQVRGSAKLHRKLPKVSHLAAVAVPDLMLRVEVSPSSAV